jgi:RNA binding exosome subunit
MGHQESPFLSAYITVIAHATEDVEKVERAVSFVLGLISHAEVGLSRRYLTGHHGNVITTISARLSANQLSPDALKMLSQRLPESDRAFLSRDMRNCLDEDGNLYLRFDKEEAFLGNLKLQHADPVRMKLKFASRHDIETMVTVCRESGLMA